RVAPSMAWAGSPNSTSVCVATPASTGKAAMFSGTPERWGPPLRLALRAPPSQLESHHCCSRLACSLLRAGAPSHRCRVRYVPRPARLAPHALTHPAAPQFVETSDPPYLL